MNSNVPPISKPWLPTVIAGLIAVAMLWLASNPFVPTNAVQTVAVPTLALLAPGASAATFPETFEWAAVSGADAYVISVHALTEAGTQELLFRQRGSTTALELAWDEGGAPPAGRYTWEVLALRLEMPVAVGTGEFVVGQAADDAPAGPPSRAPSATR